MLRFIRFYGQERYIQNTKKYSVPGGQHNHPSSLSPSIFGISVPPLRQNGESFKQTNTQSRYTIPASKEKTLCTEEPRRQNEIAQRGGDYKQV